MFGSSTPFGQPSGSPFGSPSVFGQTSNPSSNAFVPKPFGSTTPFGSPTGASIFGGTSTGMFGATSSPLASTSTFGAPSSPAFGSSTPSFSASSTPAFGSSSSSFAGSSIFGQKPTFGGFGQSPNQPNTFGSAFQQTQPTFGSSVFGSSTPFGASSQPPFGAATTPAFGATSTAAFGATSTPAFGSSLAPTFGSTGTAFGVSSAPAFGSGGAFGASSTPAFGSSGTFAFGSSITSVFGASSTPAFGASGSPAFGTPSSITFGASSTPGFSFGSTSAFGQSTSASGSSRVFGTSPSLFGTQISPFGAQTTTPTSECTGFGQSAIGGQRGGSRVVAYTAIAEVDGGNGTQPTGKLQSISAIPVYKDKSHEELRSEDYQLGDRGGCTPLSQSAGGIGFTASTTLSNPFSPTPTSGPPSVNSLSSSTTSNPFAPPTTAFSSSGPGVSFTPAFNSSPSPFSPSPSANTFGTTSSFTSTFVTSSAPVQGTNSSPSLFGTSSSPAFTSSPSIFNSTSAPGTALGFSSGFSFANTQSPSVFTAASSLGQTNASFGLGTVPSFNQSNMFAPSTGSGFGGNLFSSTPSLLSKRNPTTPSFSTPQSAQTTQNNFGQSSTGSSGFEGVTGVLSQSTFGQLSATQSTVVMQPSPVMSPFGTLPAVPQMSIACPGSTPSIQYGISSMPVSEKPAPVRISSLLTSRHLSHRRIRLPARKYDTKSDGPKVPFFSDDEETPSIPKADALFIPRENPRALVICPVEQWPLRANAEKMSPLVHASIHVYENGNISAEVSAPNGSIHQDRDENLGENSTTDEGGTSSVKPNLKSNPVHADDSIQKRYSCITVTGHGAGEAATMHENGVDVEALMPELRHSDYYTEPRILELAAKERAEPGFCCCVKDFVVGRHGYGSIMFLGKTDVRRLDLDSHVQFNNREVIVYMDESKKPPVGQGLNKPAVVTLLNIKCIDKNTGKQYIDGPKVNKYREMLIKKATDQGAEFVSYKPIEGEWKFRVQHFSQYEFRDDN